MSRQGSHHGRIKNNRGGGGGGGGGGLSLGKGGGGGVGGWGGGGKGEVLAGGRGIARKLGSGWGGSDTTTKTHVFKDPRSQAGEEKRPILKGGYNSSYMTIRAANT